MTTDRSRRQSAADLLLPPGSPGRRRYREWRARRARTQPVSKQMFPAPGSQRRVLVVDHRVPTPSHDAGSVRMAAILKALCDEGCSVAFVPADLLRPPAASEPIEALGVTILDQPTSLAQYLRALGATIDLYLLSRPEQAGAYRRMLARRCPSAYFVYDTVDLHGRRLRAQAAITGARTDHLRARHVSKLENRAIDTADLTLVVTDQERASLAESNPNARVAILPLIYQLPSRPVPPVGLRSGIVFVGGFEHHPNVDAVEYLIDELAPALARALPSARIVVVGAAPPVEAVARAPENVTFLGWVPELLPLYDESRVSIAPLRYGAGMKGKVGDAMAASLPVVTTSVGAEGFGAISGEHLVIADDTTAFVEAIVNVYTDDVLWLKLSSGGRDLIDEQFSTDAGRVRVRQILKMLS